jgi:hypothetical protein
MNSARAKVVAVAGLLAAALLLWIYQRRPSPMATAAVPPPAQARAEIPQPTNPDPKPAHTSAHAKVPALSKRSADMSQKERIQLSQDFETKYKPLVQKWLKAYEGHAPFAAEDFTLERFHSRLGDHMYTFMLGDTTFTIQDSKLGLKVSYLMTRAAAKDLNQIPTAGFVPNLAVPVTSDEVIRMVKADSGVGFKPNEVLIKPTAAACALNGGAFVNILPTGADPNNGLNYKISMVFASDGKLVNYERDPFF